MIVTKIKKWKRFIGSWKSWNGSDLSWLLSSEVAQAIGDCGKNRQLDSYILGSSDTQRSADNWVGSLSRAYGKPIWSKSWKKGKTLLVDLVYLIFDSVSYLMSRLNNQPIVPYRSTTKFSCRFVPQSPLARATSSWLRCMRVVLTRTNQRIWFHSNLSRSMLDNASQEARVEKHV